MTNNEALKLLEDSAYAEGCYIDPEALKVINALLVVESQRCIPDDAWILAVWSEGQHMMIDFCNEEFGDIVAIDKIWFQKYANP